MTHSLGSTVLKEGCVYNARTLHIHIWCWNGFPWTELGFLFYNFLLFIGSSCKGVNPIPPRISGEERTSWVPWVAKFEGLKGKQGVVISREFLKRPVSHVCVLQTPVELQWADRTCFISSPETAIFFLSPRYVQMLSRIYDIFNLFVFLLHSK